MSRLGRAEQLGGLAARPLAHEERRFDRLAVHEIAHERLRGGGDSERTRFIEGLELFGLGYSWGGYESLVVPVDPERIRTATLWRADGPLVRLHIGIEDADDLIADLAQALTS